MHEPAVYSWETLPEYVTTQQYTRILGRIIRTLPRRTRKRWARPLTAGAVLIGTGIVIMNADVAPEERVREADYEEFRRRSLFGLRWSRLALRVLRRARRVDRPALLAAGELLERIEAGVRAMEPTPDWL